MASRTRVVLSIRGKTHAVWRAVDQDGNVLDILVQSRRNTKAAKRCFRKRLKGFHDAPRVIITDTLKSDGAAQREILPGVEHRQHQRVHTRAEHSHQATRLREKNMRRFTSAKQRRKELVYPIPEPMDHQHRMELAQMIAQRLITRYGTSVKAIGLYGSLARNEDGPYSDIEMFCVLRAPGETRNYEWCAGPWKAEVNVLDDVSLRQEASQVDGRWAQTHGAFLHILPLTDPEDYFSELRDLVLSHPPEIFHAVIEEVLIGDIYEIIGKVRNAQARGYDQALAVLAVELARRTAYALGLAHRHLYGTSSSLLDEAVRLPDPPKGFSLLARMVMRGNLQHASAIVSACDTLWLGLVRWAEERDYTLIASQPIPF